MVKVIAHRGFSGSYPENTEIAFLEAIALGVDAVEFDVRLSRDSVPVVIHDGRVDRTTDGAGSVDQLTLSEIRELDAGSWFGDEFAGERILTLAEAMDIIGARVTLNIHLKPTERNRDELVPLVVGELKRRGALERVFVASDQESVELARRSLPELEVCNLTREPTDTYISRSLAIGCRILQPGNAQVEQEFVRRAHSHGMEVNPFYANDVREMRRLIQCGVDGILTDRPDLLMALRGEK